MSELTPSTGSVHRLRHTDAPRRRRRPGELKPTDASRDQGTRLARIGRCRQEGGGDMTQALIKAGIAPVKPRSKWTREAVLDSIRALHRKRIPLRFGAFVASGFRGMTVAARQHFGSWHKACATAVPSYTPANVNWSVRLVLSRIRERHRRRQWR